MEGDDILKYFYMQIDPKHPSDPKYAEIRKQIAAIEKARALIASTQILPSALTRENQRLREVSKATMDAKLYGAGVLLIMSDDSFRHVPLEAIQIDVSKMKE